MKLLRVLAVLAFLSSTWLLAAQQSPNDFLPHALGEKFTPHHWLHAYFGQLSTTCGNTMRLEKYGLTYEDRPLQIAIFSAPQNIARLEDIRLNNLRLAGMQPGNADITKPIAIVWLSMSVHGNEPSGAECSMELAYQLATQTDPKVKEWLQNTVVILDPSLNPDGYDRYTHWFRMAANQHPNANLDAREHDEPWPSGRVNHYYFDLNRDWAWATQIESQQRLKLYHRWLPHVHPDVHEQGVNDPYYFAPAAEPMHELITPWQRTFQVEIGENNARHFDNEGWFYFTKEVFDLFYPSYGDTYPTFNGAIGMTYEQAGGPKGGLAAKTANEDTLTLRDRIAHHLMTARSTIEVSSKSAALLVENFREYYRYTATQPQGKYKSFIIRNTNDPNKVQTLCNLLDQHHIRYGRVGAGMSGVKAFDYISGQEISASINPNDLVISAFQPHSVLVQALFEPEPMLGDSLTYDITAWSLIFAHGLDAYASKDRIDPKKGYEPYRAPKDLATTSPYAWCVHRKSLAEAKFLGELLQKGVRVRIASEAFTLAEQQYEPGALVISKADNRNLQQDMDALVVAAAEHANVRLYPVFSGIVTKGRDLGSEAFKLVKRPQIALVYGPDVEENSYGHTWFFFEKELEYPVTPIALDRLRKTDLSAYTTLVFPSGRFNLDDGDFRAVQEWAARGGRIIAFEGAVKSFTNQDGFHLIEKEAPEKEKTDKQRPYITRQRDGLSDGLPGAIVRATVDNTHPFAYGLPKHYHSLKTLSNAYEIPEDASVPIYLSEEFISYGFIGSRLKPQLKKTPLVVVEKIGAGDAVLMVDNPLFRSFWEQGKVLFANALFF